MQPQPASPPLHASRRMASARRAGRALRLLGMAAAAAALTACSPALDWRRVEVDDQLVAWLPCKPDIRERRAPLAGHRVPMRLLACEAGGGVWGVLAVDLGDASLRDAGLRDAGLRELNAALGTNLDAQARMLGPVSLAGQTPSSAALRVAASGRRPDGNAVVLQAWTFSRGTRIYQASITRSLAAAGTAPAPSRGPSAPAAASGTAAGPDESAETFFSGLAFAGYSPVGQVEANSRAGSR